MKMSELEKYNEIIIVERYQSNPLNEYSYRYLGQNKEFSLFSERTADLVLDWYKGELRIIKNRYGQKGEILNISDDEMAKSLLTY